jgi:type II secretory pathway component PulF
VRARRGKKKASLKELSNLTSRLSVMLEARIPIVPGLRAIAEQESPGRLRDVLYDLARQIESGSTITDALRQHEDVFGPVYVETIRAAETSGNMIEVLNQLSTMLDRQYEIRKGLKSALMYPLCVIGTLLIAVTFLMVFVVPRFAAMFEARGVPLPLPTQVVIGISVFLKTYWYLVLAGLGAGALSFRQAWRKPAFRQRVDRILHRVPYVKSILQGVAISRFASVLGVCLRSGLGLIDALEMSGKASGRPLLMADAQRMRDQVNLGGRLADVIVRCEYLPPFTRRMIASGEEAGELPRLCSVVARDYDRDVMYLTKNVSTVIEPVMIVGLAGVVLLIALAIFLPMWNMATLI